MELPEVKDVSTIPPKQTGRSSGTYAGFSLKIRELPVGGGFEFDRPDKEKERSLRSLVSSIGRVTGMEFTVRLSNQRKTIGVYRVK